MQIKHAILVSMSKDGLVDLVAEARAKQTHGNTEEEGETNRYNAKCAEPFIERTYTLFS